MILFFILLLFSLTYYGIVIVSLARSINNKNPKQNKNLNHSVSIIVAVRNGEFSLPNILGDLIKQKYSGKLEIIIVDDDSTDNTEKIINDFSRIDDRIFYVSSMTGNPILTHKKRALDAGIKKSNGDILLFTDSDCRVSPSWAQTMSSYFIDGIDYVVGYTETPKPINKISLFQSIDFFMLIIAANGAINRNWYWSSSGQNQAYKRSIYDKCNGFTDIAKYLQGDDSLFLQICKNNVKEFSANFAIEKDAQVICRQETKLIPFLLQRLRWAGDARHMWKFNPMFFLMVVATFFSNFLILVLCLLVFYYIISIQYLIMCLTFKFFIEYFLYKKGQLLYKHKFKITNYIQWFLFQIPYVVFMGLGSFFNTKLNWHNRKMS